MSFIFFRILRRLRQWWHRVPNHGPCAHCGKPVRHHYPWWTANSERGGRPLHDGECVRVVLFGGDDD